MIQRQLIESAWKLGFVGMELQAKRLASVHVYSATNLLRDYRLAYDVPSGAAVSKIASVMVCDSEGGCLPVSQHSFSLEEVGTFSPVVENVLSPIGYRSPYWQLRLSDINGDGRVDVVGIYGNSGSGGVHTSVWLSQGDGTFAPVVYQVLSSTGYRREFL